MGRWDHYDDLMGRFQFVGAGLRGSSVKERGDVACW